MRILVMLLLDTLPMLGNVLLLCFFVFFIFGIVGVQLWKGVLRNRCFFDFNRTLMGDLIDDSFQNTYYKPDHTDSFICAEPHSAGMTTCAEIPPYINSSRICNGTIELLRLPDYGMNDSICVNWNAYYTKCRPSYKNPFKGAISFDNIGFAWIAIFQIISLESWVTIMYYIQDAHSFWNWIYFVFLIVVSSIRKICFN
jgi:voltage-dependent calcium channel T type alpha-1G